MIFTIILLYLALPSTFSANLYSLEDALQKGLEAYDGERWSECIAQLEESIHLYKIYKSVVNNCRGTCNTQPYQSVIVEDVPEYKFFESTFIKRNCLKSCFHKRLLEVNLSDDVNDYTIHSMEMKTPYEYLHMCYFQIRSLQKAANAAYTFAVANPDNEMMKGNLDFYTKQPEVDKDELVDLEKQDYKTLTNIGSKAYSRGNWADCVAAMEESLLDYMKWENECRLGCERMPEQNGAPEYSASLSNIFASLLQCRQDCQNELKHMNYISGSDFMADLLNYLQISYFHLDRFEDTAKAITTYLLLRPTDTDMLKNKVIYLKEIPRKAFVPRTDIMNYINRDRDEKKLLNIFDEENSDYANTV